MDFLVLPLFLIAMLVFMMFTGTRARKRQAEMQQRLSEQLKPGAWVRTLGGFYGIVADVDGDVVVLQTTDGTETLWNRTAIAEVTEPPFAEEPAEASIEEPSEPESPVKFND
ncbi:preprotein translocase, YajC subunit [Gleimia coleocanis DSM 15436]|uniref:Preprotein translocase, YajC subunit n=1 Tax=Gleimia coleocanis DSM 15436 TaxID=525245 RepID=C0W1Q1_9ACTO|nr:preprotein translocase subunit YajC [Gleimia coleocanis]EEH63417.1 preprotein translocase, YajC subunit [Gleimia coleocanis DSM 15436]